MLKAVLFDLGDTLFDFKPAGFFEVYRQAAWRAYEHLRERGHALPPFGRFCRRKYMSVVWAYLGSWVRRRDFNGFEIMRGLCEYLKLGLDEPALHELSWAWYSAIANSTTVARGVVPTLNRLRERGLKLALVSNTYIPASLLDRHLAMHDLLELFPVRVYSSEIGHRKPHPEIFEHALEQVGVSASEALFVGDKVRNDIRGARAVGMRTVLRRPDAARAGGRSHPVADFVIGRIWELNDIIPLFVTPGPAALVRAADELPNLEELAYDA